MRKAMFSLGLLGLASAMVLTLAASPADAARKKWRVCNGTAEDVNVAVAYAAGGGYVSEGWWKVRACGGCVTVLDRDIDATGAFLRGEGVKSLRFEGDTLHCTRNSEFTIQNSSVSSADCKRKRGTLQGFSMHVLKAGTHTTTLRGKTASGTVCID